MSDIELGRRHPSDTVLAAVAKALGASFDDLKKLDNRPAMEEMKHKAMRDPRWGFAFRHVLDENITPDQLLELVKNKTRRNKK
jgi:transcriptional regulator with XRE-family HTH domain